MYIHDKYCPLFVCLVFDSFNAIIYNYYFFFQVEKKKLEEKKHRDMQNDQLLDLIEKQRLYFKTVKDFKEVIFS